MKDHKPVFGENKLQSFIDFFTNTGKVRLGTEVAGVDGTVGAAREILADATNIYMATAANTIADANWKKLVLQSL